MKLIENLQWRYATKRMNGNSISTQNLNYVLDAIQLAPTSMGVQPFEIIVISNKEVLKKISTDACKQPQILEASHLLVFANWATINTEKVENYIQNIATTRNIPVSSLDGFKNNILGYSNRTDVENANWAAKQAYIALGFGIVAAAEQNIDATPMEGFNPAVLDEILELKEKGLQSVVLLALGFRDEANDILVNAKKVRRSKNDLFKIID